MLFQGYAQDKPKIVDYKAKWDTDSFEYNNTIRKFDFHKEDANIISSLREIALRCWDLFHCAVTRALIFELIMTASRGYWK